MDGFMFGAPVGGIRFGRRILQWIGSRIPLPPRSLSNTLRLPHPACAQRVNCIRHRPETVVNAFSDLIMSERIIEGLRMHIDRDLCVSFGDCIEAAPGVFEFDDEDIAVFVSEVGPISREALIEACASCPVDALTAFDERGEQLAP